MTLAIKKDNLKWFALIYKLFVFIIIIKSQIKFVRFYFTFFSSHIMIIILKKFDDYKEFSLYLID